MKKLISLISVVLIAALMLGCASAGETALKNFLDSLKKGDFVAATKYSTLKEEDVKNSKPEELEVMKALFSSLSYKISDVKTSGDTATMKVKVTAKDGAEIVKKLNADTKGNQDILNDQKELAKLLKKYMSDTSIKTVEKEVSVEVKKTADKWVVQENADLMNAAMGGFLEALFSGFTN